jgi:hypothetical protein
MNHPAKIASKVTLKKPCHRDVPLNISKSLYIDILKNKISHQKTWFFKGMPVILQT